MAVQYLSRKSLIFGKKLTVPRRANGGTVQYKIIGGPDDLELLFFLCDNGDSEDVVVGRHAIPKFASQIGFEEMLLGDYVGVGAPRFYDNNGNLLKIGNR